VNNTAVVAGSSTVIFAVAGIVSFALESSPSGLGIDGDNPRQMVQWVRDHPEVYGQAGLALLAMAVSLTIAVLAVAELFKDRVSTLALRLATTFGLFAAAMLLIHGAMRIGSSEPVIHIANYRAEWGESAYLAVQMAGVQGVGIAGILSLCLWAVGLSLIGLRYRVLPIALVILGVFPAIRVVTSTLGVLGLLPDDDLLWLVSISGIFGLMLWCLLFGLVLLWQGLRSAPDVQAGRATAPA
jgi:hypothetical protein